MVYVLIFPDLACSIQAYQAISEEMLKKLGDKYTRFITPTKYEALRNSIVGVKGEDVSGTLSFQWTRTSRSVCIARPAHRCGHAPPSQTSGAQRPMPRAML